MRILKSLFSMAVKNNSSVITLELEETIYVESTETYCRQSYAKTSMERAFVSSAKLNRQDENPEDPPNRRQKTGSIHRLNH